MNKKTVSELSKEGIKMDSIKDMVKEAQKKATNANKKTEEYEKELQNMN